MHNFEWLKKLLSSADFQANPTDISWRKVVFLVIQNYALLFLSWTAFKNQFFFVNNISTLLYTFKKKTVLPFCFLVPHYSKCIKKLSNFHLHQQKIFWFLVLVFGFSWSLKSIFHVKNHLNLFGFENRFSIFFNIIG